VVGSHVVHHSTLDHRDRLPAVPDIFPDQRAGGLVVFGDTAALAVEDGVDRDRSGRGQGAESGGLAPTRRLAGSLRSGA
jgi:hypothetical protein